MVVLSSCSHRCQEPNAIGAPVVHRPVEVLMAATASEDYQDSVALTKKEGSSPHLISGTYLAPLMDNHGK